MPILSNRMIHDFPLTEKYALVPDLPMEFDITGAIKNEKFILDFKKGEQSRYGIYPRDSKDGLDIKWFNVDSHFVFHYGGAWNETN